MRSRIPVIAVVAALVLAACGGGDGDDADATIPEITLITTTTTEPPFVPVETEPAPAPTDSTTVAPAPSTTVAPEPEVTAAPETTAAPTTAAPSGDFTLENNGLGSVSFGAAPDGVIAFVTTFLGPPTADTGWVDPFTVGACGGTQLRQVSWGNLVLEFGDVSSIAQDRAHFYSYIYGVEGTAAASPPDLFTEEGITVGSTVAELLAAYPGVQLRTGDEFIADNFLVSADLTGRLSGLTDRDLVEMIIGGIPCES